MREGSFKSLEYYTGVSKIYQGSQQQDLFEVFLREKKIYVRYFLQFEVRSITIINKHRMRLYLSYVPSCKCLFFSLSDVDWLAVPGKVPIQA